MKVVISHGKESGPWGFKIKRLAEIARQQRFSDDSIDYTDLKDPDLRVERLLAALEQGWWPIAAAILLTSLLAVVYIWRVIEAAHFRSAEFDTRTMAREAPLSMLLPIWVLIIANLYFGIDTRLTVGVASQAAQCLLAMCI